MTLDQPKIA